jgi:predicted histidine transporter YuiF (NhaC family)
VALVVLLLLIEIAIVIIAVILAIVGGVAGGVAGLDQHLQALAAQPPEVWAAQLAPWAILGLLVYAMMAAVLQTLLAAPFIDVYRQLTAGDEAQAAPASTWA